MQCIHQLFDHAQACAVGHLLYESWRRPRRPGVPGPPSDQEVEKSVTTGLYDEWLATRGPVAPAQPSHRRLAERTQRSPILHSVLLDLAQCQRDPPMYVLRELGWRQRWCHDGYLGRAATFCRRPRLADLRGKVFALVRDWHSHDDRLRSVHQLQADQH